RSRGRRKAGCVVPHDRGALGNARMRASPRDRLTVGHYMLRQWSLEDDVRQLERLGVPSISLASTKLTAYGTRRARPLLRASGLKVAHIGSYGWFGADRRRLVRGLADVRRMIDVAHAVGADALFVLSGPLDGAPWESGAALLRDAYARLVPE